MGISNVEALTSVQSAIQMVALRNAMNVSSGTINMLVEGMQNVSRANMENSVTPFKGRNIDLSA